MDTDDVGTEGEELSPPRYALYPVRVVLWATAFGTLLAGGIVMAINYHRLGEPSAKWKTLALTTLGTVVLFAVVWFSQDLPIPGPLWLLAQIVVMPSIARSLQGSAIEHHVERGGTLVSAWHGVGIGAICTVVLAVVFGAGYASINVLELGSVVEFNNADEVYYSGTATKDDAEYLGETLTRYGVFGAPDGTVVKITASSDMYTISFFFLGDAWEESEIIGDYQELGEFLADARFGRPLAIQLCDEYLEPQKTLRIE